MTIADPTYDMEKINADHAWRTAFMLSELFNDNAPMGWGKYIPIVNEMFREARKVK
jgi:hypothetical protein